MMSIIIGLVQTRGVPFVSTNKKDFDAILKSVDLTVGETVYDLGCGKAHLLVKAAKEYNVKGVGYEISLWPYVWAKFNVWRAKANVKIYFKNFFKDDLSKADVVFCYLFPEVMAKLEDKFKKELKQGSRVVSYGFKLPNIISTSEIITNDDNLELGKIFVYTF